MEALRIDECLGGADPTPPYTVHSHKIASHIRAKYNIPYPLLVETWSKDSISNILAVSSYLAERPFSQAYLVSSCYHLYRIRLLCNRILPRAALERVHLVGSPLTRDVCVHERLESERTSRELFTKQFADVPDGIPARFLKRMVKCHTLFLNSIIPTPRKRLWNKFIGGGKA